MLRQTVFAFLLALGAAGCQTNGSGETMMTAPEPTSSAVAAGYEDDAGRDALDPGVRAGKVKDSELPEGVRMLADNEDPTRLSADPDDDKVLCKRIGVTGSRISSQRVCKTRREWRDERAQTQRGIRRQQDENQGSKLKG